MDDSKEVVRLARPLYRMATILEFFVWAAIIVGVVTGIVLAAQQSPTLDSYAAHPHPHLGAGIATASISVVAGLVFWCVLRTARVVAIDVAARHGASVLPVPESAPAAAPIGAMRSGTGDPTAT